MPLFMAMPAGSRLWMYTTPLSAVRTDMPVIYPQREEKKKKKKKEKGKKKKVEDEFAATSSVRLGPLPGRAGAEWSPRGWRSPTRQTCPWTSRAFLRRHVRQSQWENKD